MTPVAPLIVNSVSNVTRSIDEGDFLWQAQYLVKFGMIAGPRNCIFPHKMLALSAKSNLP